MTFGLTRYGPCIQHAVHVRAKEGQQPGMFLESVRDGVAVTPRG